MNEADVLIVGGGVIGLSIARELHKRGVQRIVLVEKGVCGGEASWAAAGMLGPQAEADETGEFFDLCSTSRDMYPSLAGELLEETGIDIELDRAGTLYLAFSDEDSAELYRRYKYQKAAGLEVKYLSREDVIKAEPYVAANVHGALLFSNDWQVDNRRLCDALAAYARSNNVTFSENTEVKQILAENGRTVGVDTNAGRFQAKQIILATGAWTSYIKVGSTPFSFEVVPVRGQMLEFTTAGRLFDHVIYTHRGYIVPRNDGRVLAGSTSEHAGFVKEVTQPALKDLEQMANEISPYLTAAEITGSWAGLRPFVADAFPVLGHVDGIDGLTVATGHYRNGILLAPVTAKLMADLLTGRTRSEYLETFGTGRFQPLTAGVA